MHPAPIFVIIAEDPEQLLLLAVMFHRVFANCTVQTCRACEPAVRAARLESVEAIVACRAIDADEIPLVEELSRVARAPIVALSGLHNREKLLAAGATRFLENDQRLQVAEIVAEMIGAAGSLT